ncbi:MAG: hypothetical protein KGL95_05910, partial [Patescibacteria group bacterium]|nr:hypothetical protein [Patescibacteria group bacterium]
MESKVLDKADVFSVVSEAQGFSLVGELGLWGRLNKDTVGYRFVRVIPATGELEEFRHTKNVIRGILAKEDDFVVLYSGGYNTWTDTKTLFFGLEKAMSEDKNIVFVSTGGQIEGHDDVTYANFKNLVEKSNLKDRFHLCGWVPKEDVPNYYLEADLGINVDAFTYEAILGSRTRVLDWLRASLTFISTPLSEITNYLIENQLAYGFQPKNSNELAEKLLMIASNKSELSKRKSQLKEILAQEFTYEHTSKEFLNWIENPEHAPDYGKVSPLVSAKSGIAQILGSRSVSVSHKIAFSIWPFVSSTLKIFGLGNYEEKIKKIGSELINNNKEQVSQIDNYEKYKAEFINVTVPEMETETLCVGKIIVKNIGKEAWKTPIHDPNPVNISYQWKDGHGNIKVREGKRTSLPNVIKAGKKVEMSIDITSPDEPGEYVIEIHLIKEHEFWFSEIGSKPF